MRDGRQAQTRQGSRGCAGRSRDTFELPHACPRNGSTVVGEHADLQPTCDQTPDLVQLLKLGYRHWYLSLSVRPWVDPIRMARRREPTPR